MFLPNEKNSNAISIKPQQNPGMQWLGDTQNWCRNLWCVIYGKAEIFHALRCLARCTNQKMCCDRMEQDEALDVLSAGVALGDAGTLYDSSFSCFLSKRKPTGAPKRDPEIQRECVLICSCVLCKHQFWEIHRESELGKFSFWVLWSDREVNERFKSTLQGLLWWPDMSSSMSLWLTLQNKNKVMMIHCFSFGACSNNNYISGFVFN